MPLIEQQELVVVTSVTAAEAASELLTRLESYPPVRIISTSVAYYSVVTAPKCTIVAVVETI